MPVGSCIMRRIVLSFLIAAACLAADKEKKPAESKYRNDEVEISAKLYSEKSQIQDLLGADLGGFLVVVEVTVSPKTEKSLKVYGDDFFLRTDKDGERSQPFAPSQIAGKGALVITESGARGTMMGDDRGPVWGGMGGGRPRRMGNDGGAAGNAPGATQKEANMKSGAENDTELLSVLKKKAMPEGEFDKSITGLLYFPMQGKQKVKDLELTYKGPAGKFSMRFK
jgi:hypothetical protein